jgi:hypothetical protein
MGVQPMLLTKEVMNALLNLSKKIIILLVTFFIRISFTNGLIFPFQTLTK